MQHHQVGPATGPSGAVLHISLTGLIVLCVSLIGATTWINHILHSHMDENPVKPQEISHLQPAVSHGSVSNNPWGDLTIVDVDLEQPAEYVSFEESLKDKVAWVFGGTSAAQVRALMMEAGMTEAQANAALAPDCVKDTPAAMIVNPTDAVVLSLTPAVRSNLYGILARWPENKLMQAPYHIDSQRFGELCKKERVDPVAVSTIEKLTYTRGNQSCFSDIELVLRAVSSGEGRGKVLKALTSQQVVLARLQVGENTDVDKLLGYWCSTPGVRAKDLRPLLESLRRNPGGGTISILYLLPRFARERLFTFPLPFQPGDPKMDCHWSALNFNNEVPDDRLQDNAYASEYIRKNLYSIGAPSMCGDLVFLTDNKGEVIHSAVFIADDIVFTKNGVNFGQPWVLMRMSRLMRVYTGEGEPKALFYRRREA